MLQAKHLTKIIGNYDVLNDVSFEIKEGEFVGFLGPNGAGKTSTMRLLTTSLRRSSGDLSIFGLDPNENGDKIRNFIGYLPEKPPLYPQFKVEEQIRFVASLKGVSKQNLKADVDRLLELCRIQEVGSKFCGSLSKGFRQKVGLACALIGAPKLLILDEPTSGLDPREVVEIRNLIKSFQGKTTIIFSSHILGEVSSLCERIVLFVKGRTVFDAPLKEVENLETLFLQSIEKYS
jgi:ABC-2 type transport system ATP-binding protein